MSQALYDLPDGWGWRLWKDVVEIKNGKDYKTVQDDNGLYPVYGSGGVMAYASEYLCNENAVVIGRKGTINNPLFVKEKFWNIDTAFGIEAKNELLSPKFLYYFCLSFDFVKLNTSTTLPSLTKSNLLTIFIPLPPVAEQTRIVEKLDAVLSRIDTAIDELQQSLALVDAMFKSGLDGVFADLALSYNVTALSQVVKINSGIALPSIFKESHASGAIPFYKVAQMNNHAEIMTGSEILFSSEISKVHKVTVFPKGSVLIPKRGGAILTNKKRILVEDASYDSNIMGLKANNQLISDEYLFAFMQSIDLSDFVDASTIPQINNKHIDQMMIPVPSLSEQEKAVQHINALNNHTTRLKTEITAKIGMFNQLKASVLDGAFRGEV